VPLPDDTWTAIVKAAREVGVSEVSIQRATSSRMIRKGGHRFSEKIMRK
jgi:hypothetical protein